MKVGFNAQLLSYHHSYRSAGISRYIDRILGHLGPHLRGTGSIAFVGPDVPDEVDSLAWLDLRHTRLPTQRPIVRVYWEQILFSLEIRRYSVDLIHCPAYAAPLLESSRSVVTFHDLSFLLMPSAFSWSNRQYLTQISRLAAGRAARFIAVSETTRRDMIGLLGIRPEQIDVVYNGVDRGFQPVTDEAVVADFRRKMGLPDQFILYLGTLEPRKNIPVLIRAYAVARQRGVQVPLVVAGGSGWGDLRLRELIAELGLEKAVRLIGYVPLEDQVMWYNSATLFAYPSLYEGFGLPVIEAMACGTPVVTSNRSSLPEVVGDAGIQVDPRDPTALADALVSLLRDEDARADLSSRGLVRARTFTWERSAQETYDTFRRTVGDSDGGIQPR
ncbi:MAG TPA: glycosyltransferase family 1 protein [Chloroflexota bacterium]|nr:glycosyltransferase family 1 protein [Chloroflexota bacterium]